MSLVTRCPSCGTVFRVVRDQLKVSEGWVRCGRCTEVFNAGQRLFELEADTVPAKPRAAAPAPPPATSPAAAPARATPNLAVVRVNAAVAPRSAEVDAVDEAGAAAAAASEDSVATVAALPEAAQPQPHVPPPWVAEPAAAASALAEPADATAAQVDEPAPAEAVDTVAAAVAYPTPGFVLRAERAARWRHPARRGLLALLSLLLAALLGAQIALRDRDRLAAGWPASRPWLQAACAWLGCRIEPPRRIDSLSVDSSALVRIDDSPLYRLSLLVQNRSSTVVRMPAIELALTDTQGRTTARRVLSSAELGQASDSVPPRSELALQALLDLGERGVAGYTVELFYP